MQDQEGWKEKEVVHEGAYVPLLYREMYMSANERQVGGDHYRKRGPRQHWDFSWEQNLDYFQGQITKYVVRWKDKNGLQDLHKARHFLEKYIELVEASVAEAGQSYVNQDKRGAP